MLKRIGVDSFAFALREQRGWPDQGVMLAHWITLPGDENEARSTAFRNRFTLESAADFRIGVCADAVYRLYVDGELAAAGPEQGDLAHTFLDLYELPLGAGEHSIVAIVSGFGGKGPFSRMEFRHGFFFAAEGEAGRFLDSNRTNWQAFPVPGHSWRPVWPRAFGVGLELCFDASGYPAGIESGEGENWEAVTELYPGRDARYANEFPPQPLFYPASLPSMEDGLVNDYSLRYYGADNGPRYEAADNRPGELEDVEHALKWGTFRVPAGTKVKLLLELDDYYCVNPALTVSGGKGARISLGWAEALGLDETMTVKKNRREWANRCFYGLYDHFRPDGRPKMHFYIVHYRAGRFLSLEIETAEQELHLEDLFLRESRYPLKVESSFDAGRADLAQLAKLSVRTLEMCSHDTFMDCPFFEQLMYLGDTRIQALLTLVLGRDSALVEKALRMFAASQLESGFFQSRYPSRTLQVIPTFSPFFVGMLEDYARYRGGRLVAELLPAARRSVEAFGLRVNADGLVRLDRSWNFVDWTGWGWGVPPEGEYGVSAIVNALYLYALNSLANLYELTGDAAQQAYYRDRARELSGRIVDAFWCDEKSLFADTRNGESFSEHTQILMLLAGTLPAELEERCGEALCSTEELTQATVYFSFYLFEAYYKLNRPDLFDRRLDVFREMLDLELATLLEQPEPSRSDCHAWSSHILYHFYASMLGVRPKGAGYGEVVIAPQILPGRRANGMLVHPGGGVIEIEADSTSAFIALPEGLNGEFHCPDGRVIVLKSGKQHINYR